MDFVMKHYGNHGEGEGSQVIPLCNVGKKCHMTHLSTVATRLGHIAHHPSRAHLCRK